SELLDTLKIAVPQFFEKDVYDEDGNLIKNGDFKTDKFLDELKENNVTESRDGYKLGFVGKDYARLQTGRRSERMIVPDVKHNSQKENENSNNIFITGDNLEALRHLQNAYTGKIKIIYIDPPYNSGKEFVYNDTFEFAVEQLKSALGYDENDIARLKSLQGKSSHSAWLTFMYPRLKLAQKLLTDDGVIFVSIDDNEQANLKLLLDDIFGESNFVTIFVWQDKYTTTNDKQGISSQTDYILCYAKNNNVFLPNKLPLRDEYIKESYTNDDHDGKGKYRLVQMYKKKNPICFEVVSPIGKKWKLPWNYTKENFMQMDNANRVYWGKDGNAQPQKKVYLSESTGINPINLLLGKEVGWSGDGGDEIEYLFGNRNFFSYPKNTKLIKHLLKISTNESDIIIDFFAGSGTTADAVMQLNFENGGNRKFILVQIDEPTNHDSDARKSGYNTIDEIARERINRAAKKIKTEKGLALSKDFDGGFKHYCLVKPDVQTLDKITEFDTGSKRLFEIDMIDQFSYKKMGTSGLQTLLTTWLIDDGYPFDTKIETKIFADYESHYIEKSATLYLINLDWNTKALKALLNEICKNKLIVNTIIVYVYSFDFESMRELKTNIKTNLDNPPNIIERY
ncbi:MAG: site-specific DNA-methyltransferase, partial [Prevotellaceae bacterium]|nr:site-specific DNA-methyltransferase [Prevotellaceae bacterium]